jgi:hypothetical protein
LLDENAVTFDDVVDEGEPRAPSLLTFDDEAENTRGPRHRFPQPHPTCVYRRDPGGRVLPHIADIAPHLSSALVCAVTGAGYAPFPDISRVWGSTLQSIHLAQEVR